ncbi:zinc finger protein 446-like isoform X2 [Falco cherrug]|uniref:zinc finger protein 446-like isoform X2 n=1 Tax=Falco cherrug TaxID=345164 RepID=UPI00247943B7|nr:zinc finger protein 446-like isoform X2 [Falco cherrug]
MAGAGIELRRLRFRQFRYQDAPGPRAVWRRLRELSRGWLQPEQRSKEQMMELLVLEQFLSILPEEIQSWVWVRHPQSCAQAVALAESFQLGLGEPDGMWEQQVTVRVKVEEVAPGDVEDPEVAGDPPSPPPESPQLPSGDGWQEEVALGKVKCVPKEEEQCLQEAGPTMVSSDPEVPILQRQDLQHPPSTLQDVPSAATPARRGTHRRQIPQDPTTFPQPLPQALPRPVEATGSPAKPWVKRELSAQGKERPYPCASPHGRAPLRLRRLRQDLHQPLGPQQAPAVAHGVSGRTPAVPAANASANSPTSPCTSAATRRSAPTPAAPAANASSTWRT